MHTIRLRDPWLLETDAAVQRWRRKCGMPTGIEPGDRVWLSIDRLPHGARVVFNDAPLGHECVEGPVVSWRCDVARRLQPRNEIVIEIPIATDGPAATTLEEAVGSVAFEIESPTG